jgi:hypothetical protein
MNRRSPAGVLGKNVLPTITPSPRRHADEEELIPTGLHV